MKEFLYFDEKENRILSLTTKAQVYFEDNMFWKIVSEKTGKPRTIKSVIECKEVMNQSGYEYLGEL